MTNEARYYINNWILSQSKDLRFKVQDLAPSNEIELFNEPSLVIWSGASSDTIYQDKAVNWAFRAVHDHLHLETGLGFSPDQEIELGRIQASKCDSDLIADLIYIEVSGQAEYYLKHGKFVDDQVKFTLNALNNIK